MCVCVCVCLIVCVLSDGSFSEDSAPPLRASPCSELFQRSPKNVLRAQRTHATTCSATHGRIRTFLSGCCISAGIGIQYPCDNWPRSLMVLMRNFALSSLSTPVRGDRASRRTVDEVLPCGQNGVNLAVNHEVAYCIQTFLHHHVPTSHDGNLKSIAPVSERARRAGVGGARCSLEQARRGEEAARAVKRPTSEERTSITSAPGIGRSSRMVST